MPPVAPPQIDNFVHGDLHPGNIFVTPDNKLAFLDAGIAIRYSETEHEHLIDVLTAFIQYDGCARNNIATRAHGRQRAWRFAPQRTHLLGCVRGGRVVLQTRAAS